MQNGVPDLLVFVPRHGYCGLAIEMKRPRSLPSTVSDAQKAYIRRLNDDGGFYATVCYGVDEALELLMFWLDADDLSVKRKPRFGTP